MKFQYFYDEEWDEIILKFSKGLSQYELGLSEIYDDEDNPTGEFYLFSFENKGEKGSGLGRQILEGLKSWVRDQNGTSIRTTPGGEYLHQMYSDVGFSKMDEFTWKVSI